MIPEKMEHKTIPTLLQCNKHDNCGWAAANLCAGEHNKLHASNEDCCRPCNDSECVVIETRCLPDCPQCINEKWAEEYAKLEDTIAALEEKLKDQH